MIYSILFYQPNSPQRVTTSDRAATHTLVGLLRVRVS
jgi:hypothetical protein